MKKNLKLKKITNLKNEKQLLLDFFVNIIFRDRISVRCLFSFTTNNKKQGEKEKKLNFSFFFLNLNLLFYYYK